MKSIGIAVLVLFAGAGGARACSGSSGQTPYGGTGEGTITVRSGKPCGGSFQSLGPVFETVIVKHPKHGKASVGSIGLVTYQSSNGYVGDDSFSFVRRGNDPFGKPSNMTINIQVKVTR